MSGKAPDPGSLPYRPCVGVLILNDDGLAWVGRRKVEPDGEMAGSTQLWQMPQGGIDEGETPIEAARREAFEETGMESLKLIEEMRDWVRYDLPPELVGVVWKGRYRGQAQKWFAFRFHGDVREIRVDPPPLGHKAEFEAWAWRRLDELPGLIVPFKRKAYEEVVAAFRHLAP